MDPLCIPCASLVKSSPAKKHSSTCPPMVRTTSTPKTSVPSKCILSRMFMPLIHVRGIHRNPHGSICYHVLGSQHCLGIRGTSKGLYSSAVICSSTGQLILLGPQEYFKLVVAYFMRPSFFVKALQGSYISCRTTKSMIRYATSPSTVQAAYYRHACLLDGCFPTASLDCGIPKPNVPSAMVVHPRAR